MTRIATIDFHVTSECSQECPYCWGPRDFLSPVATDVALRIVSRVREVGASRIVFTGGDPVKHPDLDQLVRRAKHVGLEVALSTTGDELTTGMLETLAKGLDLVSLPLDGSCEEINARTKKPGHFAAVGRALALLREHPHIDVKLCTPVTRHNVGDVPNIAGLVEAYARTTAARVFYNVFQTFPRAMAPVDWDDLVVSDEEFAALASRLAGHTGVRINVLHHDLLDRVYVMIFPDGSLVIPSGRNYLSFGSFLEIDDFDAVLDASPFDAGTHGRHAREWRKR